MASCELLQTCGEQSVATHGNRLQSINGGQDNQRPVDGHRWPLWPSSTAITGHQISSLPYQTSVTAEPEYEAGFPDVIRLPVMLMKKETDALM